MNLIELSKYLQDEQAAEDYLYEKEILKRFTVCPHCGSDKLGHISRGRIKCYKCKKEWHKRKGSFLEGKHIEDGHFIAILKLFSEGYGVIETAEQLKLNEKTIIEIYEQLTISVFKSHSLDSETFSESEFYLTQESKSKIETKGVSEYSYLPNETIGKITMIRNRNSDLSYSFSYKFEWINTSNRLFKNNINRFLNLLKHTLAFSRGISQKHFQQYFGILLIRYNSKEKSILNIVTDSVKNQRVVETTTC